MVVVRQLSNVQYKKSNKLTLIENNFLHYFYWKFLWVLSYLVLTLLVVSNHYTEDILKLSLKYIFLWMCLLRNKCEPTWGKICTSITSCISSESSCIETVVSAVVLRRVAFICGCWWSWELFWDIILKKNHSIIRNDNFVPHIHITAI